jgi:DNA polymerase-3 subunit beta
MKTITIKPLELKALSLFAPSADIRQHLNGVLVEANAATTRLVVTNGHYLGLFDTAAENEGVDREEIIVPIHAIESIKKAMGRSSYGDVQLVIDEGKYELHHSGQTVAFAPIDGKFPDYKRAIPERVSGEQAQFNGEYLADIHKVQRLFSKTLSAMIWPSGDDGSALFQLQGADNFIGVIMPVRTHGRNEEKPTAPSTGWARQPIEVVQDKAA